MWKLNELFSDVEDAFLRTMKSFFKGLFAAMALFGLILTMPIWIAPHLIYRKIKNKKEENE